MRDETNARRDAAIPVRKQQIHTSNEQTQKDKKNDKCQPSQVAIVKISQMHFKAPLVDALSLLFSQFMLLWKYAVDSFFLAITFANYVVSKWKIKVKYVAGSQSDGALLDRRFYRAATCLLCKTPFSFLWAFISGTIKIPCWTEMNTYICHTGLCEQKTAGNVQLNESYITPEEIKARSHNFDPSD